MEPAVSRPVRSGGPSLWPIRARVPPRWASDSFFRDGLFPHDEAKRGGISLIPIHLLHPAPKYRFEDLGGVDQPEWVWCDAMTVKTHLHPQLTPRTGPTMVKPTLLAKANPLPVGN